MRRADNQSLHTATKCRSNILCVTAWIALLPAAEGLAVNTPREQDAVQVVVNGRAMTRGSVDREVELRIGSDRDRLSPARLAALRRDTRASVVGEFVNRCALLAEADRQTIEADSNAVEARWRYVASGRPARWSSADILRIHLIGLDRTRADVTESVRIDALLNALMESDVEVSAGDIQQYREDHAEHLTSADTAVAQQIFIPVATNASAEVRAAKRQRTERMRAELLEGEAFDRVAERYSAGAVNAWHGGALGPVKRGELPLRRVEEALFSAATNTVGPVIESEAGYHIVKVISREKGRTPGDDEIKGAVDQQKRSARLRRFIDALKKQSEISYGPGDCEPR